MGSNGKGPDHTIEINSFPFAPDKQKWAERQGVDWPNIQPNSVYVATMGNLWEPGCKEAVREMVAYTNAQGMRCWYREINVGFPLFPNPAMNSARRYASLLAKNGGWHWVLFCDNDVKPEPDTLVKLVSHDLPVIVPYVTNPDNGRFVGGPEVPQNSGLMPLLWHCSSFQLFECNIFNCPNVDFGDSDSEGILSARLKEYRLM